MSYKTHIDQSDRSVYSLRQRYLFVSSVVVLLIFAFTWLAQSYINRHSARHSHNIKLRQEAGLIIRQLRDEILHTEKSLEAFLWGPSEIYRTSTHHGIDSAILNFTLLRQHEWFKRTQLKSELADFALDLEELHVTVNKVMDLRLHDTITSNRPDGATLGTSHANQHFAAATDKLQHLNPAQAPLLTKATKMWEELQQQLLATRWSDSSSGTNSGTQTLPANIVALQGTLEQVMGQLAAGGGGSKTSSQQQQLLDEMAEAMQLWHLSYKEQLHNVNSVHHNYTLYLEQTVNPHFDHLWSYIKTLERHIDNFAGDDTTAMNEVAGTIVRILWLFSIFALVMIAVAYLYFQRTVLGPIATVATALKQDAQGEQMAALPKVHNLESRQLIEAYEEMHRQVRDRQKALEHIALHDGLTSLPNRYQLMNQLQAMCETFEHEGAVFAVLMLGLDRFKEVNDTLGQQTGDDILKKFGQRLRALLRDHDNVARFASDEFAVLLHHTSKEEALYVARKIMREMEQPFEVDGINLSISCSIGVALFPEHGEEKEELTRRANIAMTTAKQHKIGIAVYKDRYDTSSVERISLAGKLRQAIQTNTLHLCYQPQYSTHSKGLSGLEVLCRWEDHERGTISPNEFIPIAEQSGQVHALTEWVLGTALQNARQWQKRGLECGTLSINISAFNLHAPNFIPMLKDQLNRWGFPAHRLMLEVTETAMMVDPEHAIKTMRKLHELGIKLSIDDYGTGFSSLAYVKQLPVDELKIDKSFVMDMTHDENDAVIVRSTIDLAHNLGLKVVAEGVDSQEKADLLEILNCDYLQGYHLGMPQTAEQIEPHLPSRRGKDDKVKHLRDYR